MLCSYAQNRCIIYDIQYRHWYNVVTLSFYLHHISLRTVGIFRQMSAKILHKLGEGNWVWKNIEHMIIVVCRLSEATSACFSLNFCDWIENDRSTHTFQTSLNSSYLQISARNYTCCMYDILRKSGCISFDFLEKKTPIPEIQSHIFLRYGFWTKRH